MKDNELSKKIKEVNLTAADIRAESGDRIGLNQARQWLRFEINGRGLSNAVRLMLELLIEKKRAQAKFGAQAQPSPLSSEAPGLKSVEKDWVQRPSEELMGELKNSLKQPSEDTWVEGPNRNRIAEIKSSTDGPWNLKTGISRMEDSGTLPAVNGGTSDEILLGRATEARKIELKMPDTVLEAPWMCSPSDKKVSVAEGEFKVKESKDGSTKICIRYRGTLFIGDYHGEGTYQLDHSPRLSIHIPDLAQGDYSIF